MTEIWTSAMSTGPRVSVSRKRALRSSTYLATFCAKPIHAERGRNLPKPSIWQLLLKEQREQRNDRLVLKAQGKDTGGGSAQAEIVMSATPSGTGVSLHAEARVFLTGRIASFGRSLAGDVSRRMFEDFARGMDRAAAGAEPDTSAKPPGAMAILWGALSDQARARFRNLRRRRRDSTPRRDRRRTPSRDER